MMKVTMKEIARQAGVSPSTVSLAFQNSSQIPVEAKHKILKIASELNYVYPRKVGRKVHGVISLIIEQLPIPAISDSFCGEIIQGMEVAVREYGYHLSLHTLQAIREANLRVPEDISLIGFDDIVEAVYLNPPLTTVRVPKKEMGEIAVIKLLSAINRENYYPSKTVLYTELVERDSC